MLSKKEIFVDYFSIQCYNGLQILVSGLRCFEDDDIVHVNGRVDPKADIDLIKLELILSHLDEVCQRECVQHCCFSVCLCIREGS